MTPDIDAVLGGLKDFQRATVDYAFERLFAPDGTGRFLVADEVGLGKTLVARGVVARTIAQLLERQQRISIVYVCSNADIARQNIKRLAIPGVPVAAHATRVTLLATELAGMEKRPVNIIALTPATSFEQSGGGGRYDERVLLHALLDAAWSIRGRKAAIHVLRNQVGPDRFSAALEGFDGRRINREIRSGFLAALKESMIADRLAGRPDLKQRFETLCVAYARSNSNPSPEERTKRKDWISELRQMLAQVCLRTLRPDLIILDEFQRFGHLLRDTEEIGELARDFLHSGAGLCARILLLSATPYRALSLHHEANDDHHRDFLTVLAFLGNGGLGDMEAVLADYRKGLETLTPQAGSEGRNAVRHAAEELEARLRSVMARTERTRLGNGKSMLREVNGASLGVSDIEAYLGAQKIVDALEEGDVLEYWKSAPYLFNFMDDYTLKRALEDRAAERHLIELVRGHKACFLDREDLENYRPVDPMNARLRGLMADTVGRGLWRLLWLPPSLPYYRLGGPFAAPDLSKVTKRLVFSAWHMVPRAVASLLSYEAERAMMRAWKPRGRLTHEDRAKQRALLRFNVSAGRPAGLRALLHVYPSLAFAKFCDPRDLARDGAGSAASVEAEAARRIGALLDGLKLPQTAEGAADENWYWLAPMLLDEALYPQASAAWWKSEDLAQVWGIGRQVGEDGQDEAAGWPAHVEQAHRLLTDIRDGTSLLGRQPDDLLQVLAVAALASPATSALRALSRRTGDAEMADIAIRAAAGRVGHGFVSLFNHPEVIELLRAGNRDDAYWRITLDYAHGGCLQAVLDEYAHLLIEASGGTDGEARARDIADAIVDALMIRTANLSVDTIGAPRYARSVQIVKGHMRNRFAMRFGDPRNDEDQPDSNEHGVTRKERVRAAFNSPFWPFVLVSTSVGQEGLDFHYYCHAVTHWNLPSNPVDLEQREGRVHRYKGHAVRKNVARACGLEALRSGEADIWREMFDCARRQRPAGRSDLEPYWLFDGEASIERHVPALPYSRDAGRLHDLRSSLAIYRMVFGQSRQEDLIAYLQHALPEEDRDALAREAQIDLCPLRANGRAT